MPSPARPGKARQGSGWAKQKPGRAALVRPDAGSRCLLLAWPAVLAAQTPVSSLRSAISALPAPSSAPSEGHPLSRARVSLRDVKNAQNQIFMITGDDGHFEFANLPAGKYSLVGAKRGYISAAYDQHEQFSTAIVTGAGVDTENLTLRLVPTAVLTGHVFDESGEPVRDASGHALAR